jgi:hypothetical protein
MVTTKSDLILLNPTINVCMLLNMNNILLLVGCQLDGPDSYLWHNPLHALKYVQSQKNVHNFEFIRFKIIEFIKYSYS